jgi:hypothetical protein
MFPAHQSSSIGSCANITSIEKEERALQGAESQQKDIGRKEKSD